MTTTKDRERHRLSGNLLLRGPARLVIDGDVVRVRRKGLALLYYLAIEGPTRRDSLAHLLWGHGRALQNLRVELHRLREALGPFGIAPFAAHADPLELAGVVIHETHGSGDLLDGLDDITPAFQDWLDRQRLLDPVATPPNPRAALVEQLARGLSLPFVLVLSGEPGSGRRDLARDIAAKLRLPLVDGQGGGAPAVNFISLNDSTCEGLYDTIAAGEVRLWVLARSSFGEDPRALLRLRASCPPERMRFVHLEPLRWWEARPVLPRAMPFSEGARLFAASLGNPGYLTELIKLGSRVAPGAPLPVPLTLRASFALEARKLSFGARKAIESASVHPGAFSPELLRVIGAEEHLAELEASGWLEFDGAAWRFSNELARRMLCDLIPEGTKSLLHARVATQLKLEGAAAVSGRRLLSRVPRIPPALERRPRDAGRAPPTERVVVSDEVWLDAPEVSRETITLLGDEVILSRTIVPAEPGTLTGASSVTWDLAEEPLLFRLRGKGYLHDEPHRTGFGAVSGLTLRLLSANALDLHLCHPSTQYQLTHPAVRLPLTEEFDYWLLGPPGRKLQIESLAQTAVIEFRLNAYRYRLPGAKVSASAQRVDAYVLEKPTDDGRRALEPLGEHSAAEAPLSWQ